MGSAQDPASLNRFLYAAANPATLIDPDGHCGTRICNIDGGGASQADAAIAYTRLAETNARAAARSLPQARDFSRSGDRGERAWSGGSDSDYARKVRATSIARQVAARNALAYAGLAGMAGDTYEARVEIVRHEATALEVLAIPVAVLGGGFVAAAGGAALTSGAMSVVRAGAGFVADVWAGWTTAGAAGACVMGVCPAGIAVGQAAVEAAGGSPVSPVGAVAGVADDAAGAASRLSTGADDAVFWSGLAGGPQAAASWVERYGGTTLEVALARRGIAVPVWDSRSAASVDAWRSLSWEFAAGARGDIRVLQGETVRVSSSGVRLSTRP